MTNWVCPILREPCIGKDCAMAVELDHPNVSAYSILWKCGLVNDGEQRHRKAHVICSESKQ